MQEYPETAAYRRGWEACRAELGAKVVAWLEAQDMAFEAMLEACEGAMEFLEGMGYEHGDVHDSLQDAIAQAKKAKKGEA